MTLSRHLGALTPVWVFPLSERELTPRIPSPAVFDTDSFGVRQTSRGFPPISHQSVLYTIGCLALGLTAASFGRNQLSPGLIGLSPLAQGYPTELHIKTGSALHRAKLGFSLPRTRSPGFGSQRRDSGRYSHPVPRPFGLRTFRFRFGSGVELLNLATTMNSLARDSRRTVRPRFSPLVPPPCDGFLRGGSTLSSRTQQSPPGFRLFSPPFRGAFRLSLAVLRPLSVSSRI